MKNTKTTLIALSLAFLGGCEGSNSLAVDGGLDHKNLRELKAGIWVDPHGCDHWIVDDGWEGYLSQRLDRNGKPVCSGVAPPGYTSGNFKGGSTVEDPY